MLFIAQKASGDPQPFGDNLSENQRVHRGALPHIRRLHFYEVLLEHVAGCLKRSAGNYLNVRQIPGSLYRHGKAFGIAEYPEIVFDEQYKEPIHLL